MENNDKVLIQNIDKIHTTEMGYDRLKKNLKLDIQDVVKWCKSKIIDKHCRITKTGKNWYVVSEDCIITINTTSYTIITAHIIKHN